MENFLEVKNLNKKYNNFALKDVSFSLPKGMIMGFIGENGSGKTTTIKAILDIIKDYTGEVKIFGQDSKEKEDKIKEDIGVVLDNMFYPEILTPKDINNSMKHIFKNWDEKLFYEYLAKFSLDSHKQIKKLSKGMRKKLEIATALSHKPKLLILDEPLEGLDPIARHEIVQIFQKFIQDGEASIFLSSHITTDLEHIADYITFINQGQIIFEDTCDKIINNYGIVKCNQEEFKKIDHHDYLSYIKNKYNYEILINNKKEFKKKYSVKVIDKITLEDFMVLMIRGEKEC